MVCAAWRMVCAAWRMVVRGELPQHREDVDDVRAEEVAAPDGIADPLQDAGEARRVQPIGRRVGPHPGEQRSGGDQAAHVDGIEPADSHHLDEHTPDRWPDREVASR